MAETIDKSFNPISFEQTEKILGQMKNYICKIIIDKVTKGTGFLCKIPLHGDNKLTPVLITNNNVINDNMLARKKDITIESFCTTSIKRKKINLSNRTAYNNKKLGISIIEIVNKDGFKNINMFELDEDMLSSGKTDKFIDKSIYMIHSNQETLYVSYGLVNDIGKNQSYNFMHTCKAFNGSSGSPILNLENNKIIGIHSSTNVNINEGFFLNFSTSKENISKTQKEIKKTEFKATIKDYESAFGMAAKTSSKDIKFENLLGLSIETKRGFYNYGTPGSSKLNSLIQILTSIKEIHDDLRYSKYNEKSKQEIINKYNNIYVFTSFFLKALNEIYKNGKPDEYVSLKQMDILLKFIDKDLTNKSIYDYLMIILELLHQEFLSYPNNIPCQDNLISFSSPYGQFENSKNIFYNYYNNEYKKSKISELFNWIRREKKICDKCNKYAISFQAFPILLFNLDKIDNFLTQYNLYNTNNPEKILKLDECFQVYSLQNDIKNNQEKCEFCQAVGSLYSNYSFQTSPKYLFIIINRIKKIKLAFSQELKLQKDEGSDLKYTKYKLAGVIIKEENNNYSCVLKQNEYENERGTIIEEWKKFYDENAISIKFDKESSASINQIFDPLNAEILIYKGI
jgi:hypothetical protein